MSEEFKKIVFFLEEHHVLSLATSFKEELSVCSLFYAYSKEQNAFVFASSKDTTHIEHIKKNSTVAGNILLETKEVGKIQGIQFKGEVTLLKENSLKAQYFKEFPYALALLPTLWKIEIKYFKMTDNRLGFGKKIIWKESSV